MGIFDSQQNRSGLHRGCSQTPDGGASWGKALPFWVPPESTMLLSIFAKYHSSPLLERHAFSVHLLGTYDV